jgi:hypothetical protein
MLFGVQIPILRNKSEVVLHQQFDGFSEQSALHHGENQPIKNHYCPAPINITHE